MESDYQSRFNALFDLPRDIIVWLGPDGTVLEINQQALAITGFRKEELVGRRFDVLKNIFPPDSLAKISENFGRRQRGEKIDPYEVTLRSSEGSTLYFELTANPIRELDGNISGEMVILREISHHKQVELDLRESAALLRIAIDDAPVGVVMVGLDKLFLKANKAFCNFLGMSEAELKGKSVADITYPEDRELGLADLPAIIAGKMQRSVAQKRYVRRDGTVVWGEVAISLIRDEQGSPQYFLSIIIDINERKRAETALSERERRLSSIYETVDDVIFQLAVEGEGRYRFSSVNRAFFRVTGLTAEQVIGKSVHEIIPEPSLDLVLERYAEAIRSKNVLTWEETSDYPTGRLIGEVHVAPVFNEAGICTSLVGAVHDITERKQIEDELRLSEQNFRLLFDNAPLGIGVVDLAGNLLAFNKAILQPGGYTAEEIRQLGNVASLYYDVKQRAQALDRFQGRGGVKDLPVKFRRKDGSPYDANLSLARTTFQGKPALLAIVEDTTERKRAEEELRLAKEFSDNLIFAAPNIIVGLGVGSEIKVFNKFAERLTGYTAEEVMGKSWIDIFIPEAVQPEIKAVWDKIVKQSLIQHHYDNPIVTKDGRERLIAWDNTVLTESGQFKMVLSIGQDVTEIRQLEQSKETLFRNISHKLKSPLAMMTMGMELWRGGLAKKDEKKMRKAVDLISKHLSITSRDINSIITFFTLTAGQRSLPKETVPLNTIVKEIMYDLQPLADEQIVTLSNEMPLNDLPVQAVREEMRILFHNLIENAVKFTERGEVTVRAAVAGPEIKVFIQDTGRGMNKVELNQLGKEFYQHNPEVKGLGLGLAISQEIAQRHGGELKIDSPGRGKGTTVTVILPVGGEKNG